MAKILSFSLASFLEKKSPRPKIVTEFILCLVTLQHEHQLDKMDKFENLLKNWR